MIKILPKKNILDGKGYWWEYILSEKGWNDLPVDRKIGYVNDCMNGIYTLHFPALNHTTGCVFRDEFVVVP